MLRDLIQTFRSLPRPGPSPADASSADMVPGKSVDELDAELRGALDRLVQPQDRPGYSTDLNWMPPWQQAAHAAFSDCTRRKRFSGHHARQSPPLRIKLLNETIQPLAHEIDARWGQLFPGRGRLSTQSTGAVSREHAGETLPDTEFSTGERTGLVILLRLLVLETVTKANFCWLDEPLEHLDPDPAGKSPESSPERAA